MADKIARERAAAVATAESERKSLKRLVEERKAVERACAALQAIAQQVQQHAHEQVARVVTRCLRTVFGEDAYEFRIVFERKRGRTEARLVFVPADGLAGGAGLDREIDPVSASGGGVVDVAAFALRLSCLLLSVPRRRRLLVLDEPFKHLSAKYRPRVRELLKALSEELKVQIVMVTHSSQLVVGDVIRIGGET